VGLVSILLGECGNDAPLEQADIGVRSEVTKQAANMILTDDSPAPSGQLGPHLGRTPRETMQELARQCKVSRRSRSQAL